MHNDLWKDIKNLSRYDNYIELELFEYQILNDLFSKIQTVKYNGGGANLDFFLGQYGNNITSCVNIERNIINRDGMDILQTIEHYKQKYNYKGSYHFDNRDALLNPIFNYYYDCVCDCIGPEKVNYEFINPPKYYVLYHYAKIENFSWITEFDKKIPLQFATKNLAMFSHIETPIYRNYHNTNKVKRKRMTVNSRELPVLSNGRGD